MKLRAPIDEDVTITTISYLDDDILDEPYDGDPFEILTSKGKRTFPEKDQELTKKGAYIMRCVDDPTVWKQIGIKAQPGGSLVEFVIGAIPPSKLNSIEDDWADKPTQRYWECFCASLRDLRNAPAVAWHDGGKQKKGIPKEERHGLQLVTQDYINQIFAKGSARSMALSIGRIVYMWNLFGDQDAKN